tara:strand:- start:457 stop:1089 length:633 start_codon:yes stop_codon:yes gene_type:complete
MNLFGSSNDTANTLSLGLPNGQQSLPSQYAPGGMSMGGWGAPPMYEQTGASFGAGLMGAMGMQPAAPMAPPSDLEVMAALIQTSAPVDRWFSGPNMQTLVSLMYKVSSLATIEVLKNAKIVEDDNGDMIFDFASFSTAPTSDSVTMEANNLQNSAQAQVTAAHQQQQAILNMVQQNLMSGALSAAMANPGMMESVGSGVGSVFRSMMGVR